MGIYLIGVGIALISLIVVVTLWLKKHRENVELREGNKRLRDLVRSMADGDTHVDEGIEE